MRRLLQRRDKVMTGAGYDLVLHSCEGAPSQAYQ